MGHPRRLYLVVTAFFLCLCGAWFYLQLRGGNAFWDAEIYANALRETQVGHNPYQVHTADVRELSFVYPPIFLKVAECCAWLLPKRTGWPVYIGAIILSVLAMPWLMARSFFRAAWMTPAVAMILFAFEPRLIGELVLLSGNIGTVFYTLALAAAIPGVRSRRWIAFYAVILIASLIKPTFLALLLLPMLADGVRLLGPACTTALSVLAYGAQMLWMPEQFRNFRFALREQLLVRHDVGIGLYSFLTKLGDRTSMRDGAIILHFALIGISIVLLAVFKMGRRRLAEAGYLLPLLLLLGILANPRLQPYDADVAMIPAVYLCVQFLRQALRRRSAVVLIAAPIACFVALLSRNADAAICLLLNAAAVLGLFQMRRSKRASLAMTEATTLASELTLTA